MAYIVKRPDEECYALFWSRHTAVQHASGGLIGSMPDADLKIRWAWRTRIDIPPADRRFRLCAEALEAARRHLAGEDDE